jgi:hypothetical protein
MPTRLLNEIEHRLRSALLPAYPDIHHAQLYRTEDGRLVLWLSVTWPVPFAIWDELPDIVARAEQMVPIAGIQINELGVLRASEVMGKAESD